MVTARFNSSKTVYDISQSSGQICMDIELGQGEELIRYW